jgi:DNA polymerase-1
MKNSKGFPTNGLFGFVNMMNKIISEEDPKYIMVAFDIGKTFRHEKYEAYKGGRNETPDDLKKQFPVAKEILNAMGIKYLEKEGYEADDIIGTFAKMVDENDDYEATIVSSDKDLLQLISNDVEVKLLKTKDYIRMTTTTFKETYGIEPIRMIDLKSLMGDASDNIPGVKGIGEKTALKLLQEYDTLENIYDNIDSIKGSIHDKLVKDKDMAFMSKEMVTIDRNVPIDINLEDIYYCGVSCDDLIKIYTELEFHSFLKNIDIKKKEDIKVEVINDISKVKFNGDISLWLELDNDNYHTSNIISISVYDGSKCYYIDGNIIDFNIFENCNIWTYDAKKLSVILLKRNIRDKYNICEDAMIMGYLLNYNVKDDVAYLASDKGYDITFYDKKNKLDSDELISNCGKKAKFIYDMVLEFRNEIEKEDIHQLYYDIELPLTSVLARMEYTGIRCDVSVLKNMGEDILKNLDIISQEIYNLAGHEFNISSPKQLGDILFEEMKLPYAKKNRKGYSTDITVLSKLKGIPIVDKVLEYRTLSKLYSTYIEGLINSVSDDGKIHTIYTQTLTRTGRLSSIEPNLQNIPARSEYGRLIRKAFKPEEDSLIMSCDYSQIELRIFASLSKVDDLINAFKNGIDIHTKTASDVFHINIEDVTKDMRRKAKAVNFGIIYGISSYGLSEDLGIRPKEAKEFIDSYMEAYPGIKNYMDNVVSKAHRDGYVKTIMNRKRIIDELHNTNYQVRSMGERMALNTPIQGSSADILKKAMVDIDNEFRKLNLKSKMLLQVHDELIFNVYVSEKDIVSSIVVNLMENAYKLDVPLEVSMDFGTDWYDAK